MYTFQCLYNHMSLQTRLSPSEIQTSNILTSSRERVVPIQFTTSRICWAPDLALSHTRPILTKITHHNYTLNTILSRELRNLHTKISLNYIKSARHLSVSNVSLQSLQWWQLVYKCQKYYYHYYVKVLVPVLLPVPVLVGSCGISNLVFRFIMQIILH